MTQELTKQSPNISNKSFTRNLLFQMIILHFPDDIKTINLSVTEPINDNIGANASSFGDPCVIQFLILRRKKEKLIEFANSVDSDEAAHNYEPPHLDLQFDL